MGTLSIAGLHALIPSHWLAFAVVGRRQRWTVRRTLLVTTLAGAGHILMTIVFGLVLAAVGKQLQRAIPPQLEHGATAVLLILLGLYFAVTALRGGDTCPTHPHGHGHHHYDDGEIPAPKGMIGRLGESPTIIGALVLGMTLSPCLDLLSVYVAAADHSWSHLLLISLIMAVTTLGLMTLLVWLTLRGLQRLNLRWLERHEGLAVGALLIVLGALLFFL